MSTINQNVGDFIKDAMHRYGTEVIENRALPRIEDGLRPSQRLILWSAHCLKAYSFVKSAKVVGATIAEFSPHGTTGTYGSLVNMVNMRYAPFKGQGNFGGLGGVGLISAAAERYTEVRLAAFFREFSTDLPDVKQVPYEKNFDETRDQPVYLPTILPYLLLGGCEGIAVGLVSKIPTFNFKELCDAVATYIISKDIDKAIRKIKAPDGFDCSLISSKKEVADLFAKGEGSLEYECQHKLTPLSGNKGFLLEITGYTPDFQLESFLNKCGKLSEDDVIDYVRNETSAKNGNRIVIAFKTQDIYDKKLKPMLRKSISYKFNVLVPNSDGHIKPELLSLHKIIELWLGVRRKTVFDTLKAKELELAAALSREEAKRRAILNLDKIFDALRAKEPFKVYLESKLGFTSDQASYIAEMRIEALQRTSLQSVDDQIEKNKKAVEALRQQLGNIDAVIIEQIKHIASWVQKNQPDFMTRKISVPF